MRGVGVFAVGAVADRVPSSVGGAGVRVGVDGVDGSGKTTFADALGEELRRRGRPVVRISADDFHHPRAVRYRLGRHSPEGFFRDSYDLDALRRNVLDPFGPGGDRCYREASHDLLTDAAVDGPTLTGAPGTVLVLDGLFLHRDELLGTWELSVFLDVPFEETFRRMAIRDGCHPDPGHPDNARYVDGQRLYLAAARPRERADLVLGAPSAR